VVSAAAGDARDGDGGGDLRNGRRFVVAAAEKEEEVACEFAVAVPVRVRFASSARVCGVGRTPPELRCLVNTTLGPRVVISGGARNWLVGIPIGQFFFSKHTKTGANAYNFLKA
jgi:hypothetical protein